MNAVKNCMVLHRNCFPQRFFIVAATFLLLCGPADAELLFFNDQTVQSYVAQLRSDVVPRDSHGYLPPSDQQRTDFRSLADGLRDAISTTDLSALEPAAEAIGYDVVVLNDSGTTYYGLQESSATTRKGWGSYLLRQNASSNAIVEVAHPLADINTSEISAQAFVDSGAKGFLIAGAHRNANGLDTADVGDLSESIFQEIHESFAENAPNFSAWQVHGFDIDLHPELPADTDAIISSGTGSVTEIVLGLDQNIDSLAGDWTSYAHNTLNVSDSLNIATNGNVAGPVFNGLAGATNIQQLHTTSIGGQFVHIELEQSFRIDGGESARQLISQTIANAISSSTTAIPEPSTFVVVGLLSGIFALRRRRS